MFLSKSLIAAATSSGVPSYFLGESDLTDSEVVTNLFASFLDDVAKGVVQENVEKGIYSLLYMVGWSRARVNGFRKTSIFRTKFYQTHCFDHVNMGRELMTVPMPNAPRTAMEAAFLKAAVVKAAK